MMTTLRPLWMAAALLALPVAAQATTVNLSANQFISEDAILSPGGALEFRYNVLDDLDIASIAVSGTGNSSGGDLAAVTFGYTSPGTVHFSSIFTDGTSAFAGGFLPGLKLKMGDVFSVFFDDGVSEPVAVTLSFLTTPAQIPVPASGILLAGVLLGLGAWAKRGRKDQFGDLTA